MPAHVPTEELGQVPYVALGCHKHIASFTVLRIRAGEDFKDHIFQGGWGVGSCPEGNAICRVMTRTH